MVQVPTEFIEKYNNLIGVKKTNELLASFLEPVKKAFRLNPLKENFRNVSYDLSQPVGIIDDAFFGMIDGNQIEQLAGYVYSQDPAAMFVVQAAKINPGEKVLDLCAAPGGKSTQIASHLNQEGLLVANEINPARSKILLENIERWGVKNAVVTNESPDRLALKFPDFFDKIVVDAPCSGEGMFRKDPEAMEMWSQELVLTNQKRQKMIVDEAYKMLAPGGELIYSTCTFAPEENEQIVEYLLKNHSDLDLVPIKKDDNFSSGHPEWTASKNPQLKDTARFWTMDGFGEGQFVAVLKKRGASQYLPLPKVAPNLDLSTRKILLQTLKDLNIDQDLLVLNSRNHLFIPAISPDLLSSLKILRNGVEVGELKGKRIALHHQLSQVLNPTKHPNFEIPDEEQFIKFRHGETLPVKDAKVTGFALVTYQGKSFSWGKIGNDHILKNFYPKGLRK